MFALFSDAFIRVANRNIRFLERQASGSGNPPQISSAFTSTTVIPFPGGNFANPDNPISEDTEYLPGLNERGERDGSFLRPLMETYEHPYNMCGRARPDPLERGQHLLEAAVLSRSEDLRNGELQIEGPDNNAASSHCAFLSFPQCHFLSLSLVRKLPLI